MTRTEIVDCWLCDGGRTKKHYTDGVCESCNNSGKEVAIVDESGKLTTWRPATEQDLAGDDHA